MKTNNKECKLLEFKRKDTLDLIDISERKLSEEELELLEEKEAIQKAKRINEKIFRFTVFLTGISVLMMLYMFVVGLIQFDFNTMRLSMYGAVLTVAVLAISFGVRNAGKEDLYYKECEINTMLRNMCRS